VRAELGPFVLAALFGVSGLCLLDGAGLLRRTPLGVVAAAGLAYLTGAAACGLLLVALLVLGAPFTLFTVVLVAVAVGAAGAALGRMRRRDDGGAGVPTRRLGHVDRVALAAFAALLAVFALKGLRSTVNVPLAVWDSWSIWTRKAVLLTEFDELPLQFFGSPAYAFMHIDYPILLPVLEAVGFRAAGVVDTQAVHAQVWLLLPAAMWALAYLVSSVARPIVWAPLVSLVAVVPEIERQLTTAYADVPAGLFLSVGVLCIGLWLTRGNRGHLAVGVLLLAAAANVKNEGLASAAAVLGVLAVVLALSRRREEAPAFAVAAGLFTLLVLPWRVWVETTGPGDPDETLVSAGVGSLSGRAERIGPAIEGLYGQITDTGKWSFLVPLGLAVAIGCLALSVKRTAAAFYLGAGTGVFAAIAVGYGFVGAHTSVEGLLGASVERTAGFVVFVGLAAFVHLTCELAAFTESERQAP
jgi:hypothetical protein